MSSLCVTDCRAEIRSLDSFPSLRRASLTDRTQVVVLGALEADLFYLALLTQKLSHLALNALDSFSISIHIEFGNYFCGNFLIMVSLDASLWRGLANLEAVSDSWKQGHGSTSMAEKEDWQEGVGVNPSASLLNLWSFKY